MSFKNTQKKSLIEIIEMDKWILKKRKEKKNNREERRVAKLKEIERQRDRERYRERSARQSGRSMGLDSKISRENFVNRLIALVCNNYEPKHASRNDAQ